jgi:hypothetical protein
MENGSDMEILEREKKVSSTHTQKETRQNAKSGDQTIVTKARQPCNRLLVSSALLLSTLAQKGQH